MVTQADIARKIAVWQILERRRPYPGQRYRHGWIPVSVAGVLSDILSSDARDADLRRVFEGEFGGLRTTVDDVGGTPEHTWLQGSIRDASGNRAGQFGYAIDAEGDETWAELSDIHLEPGYRGKGFSAAFNQRILDWLRRSGATGVRVEAEEDGGYAWAALRTEDGRGFEFASAETAAHILDKLALLVEFRRAPNPFADTSKMEAQLRAAEKLLERARRTKWGDPGFPTLYEISQLGRTPGAETWIGKELLVDSEWTGELRF